MIRSNGETSGFGYYQNKGRWQGDHFLKTGHLAILKGENMKIKNVQIPYTLFRQLVVYHLMEDQSCSEEICKGLMEKVERMANQQLYTQSKTARTEKERETARQEYLDKRGIPDSLRW